MWFESQNCAMMGLQATTGKRKLEAATAPGESSPPKSGRWEADDCIARLQAVAVPSDAWRSPTPSLAATLLSTDDFDEDDEFDDELSDDDRCVIPEPARFTQHPFNNGHQRYHHHPDYWQYYQPPQQQTIRCEENGKSYLELGASPPPQRTKCCDGRTRWCHVPCYRQRRLAVLNLSMCKLARYRQCSDPSLRRSVLICNTLRRLEREMESEPTEPCYPNLPELTSPSRPSPVPAEPHHHHHHGNGNHHHHHHHHHNNNSNNSGNNNNNNSSSNNSNSVSSNYEQSLRDMTSTSGRATPFPSASFSDTDSGLGDDEMTRPINWGSVLSLTSQTDLESLNNNELYAELGLSGCGGSAVGDPPEWKEPTSRMVMATASLTTTTTTTTTSTTTDNNEWDGFMHVLVGGT